MEKNHSLKADVFIYVYLLIKNDGPPMAVSEFENCYHQIRAKLP